MRKTAQAGATGDAWLGRAIPPALLAIACMLLAAALPARAEGSTDAARASGRVEFRVIIPTVLKVNPVSQPAGLRIEDHHVGQGYVDLDEATQLQVTSNSRGGIDLSVVLDSALVQRAVVRLLGSEVNADGAGSVKRIDAGRLTDQAVRVSYRFYLDPRVRAGDYRWPVSLRFSPVTA